MYCKQNQKINQVKECTLVVGIDIGSTTHYARAFDWRGIELGDVFKFSNSLEGFQSLSGWMQRIMKKTEKSEVMVGIEPTGHYWFDLGAYLENGGILLVMVNPLKKKQSVIAISCKLIRVFYAILTKGAIYDGEKMLSDIHRNPQIA